MEKPTSPLSGIAILGIGTAVPPHRLEQDDTAKRIAGGLAGHDDAARWVRRIFRQTSVETRYTCEPDLLQPAHLSRYAPGSTRPDIPATSERLDVYRREAVPLALEAARRALRDGGVTASGITHLITVSCTGLFLPGLDSELVWRLGLSRDVNRIPLTFVGCAAGMTALRLARELAAYDARARILIVCVELCTIHIQPSVAREDLFAASLFGDGAAACVVGRAVPRRDGNAMAPAAPLRKDDVGEEAVPRKGGVFVLGRARTTLIPDTMEDMWWRVGDTGFRLYLSPQIPSLIGRYVPAEIARLQEEGDDPAPEWWAIHPGGRGIVDALQQALELTDAQTQASRDVLRRHGNMSSATILFVLREIRRELDAQAREPKRGMALAFGPGMTAELMRMDYVPAGALQAPVLPGERDVAAVP